MGTGGRGVPQEMKPFLAGFASVIALIGVVVGFVWWFLEREKKAYLRGRA